MADAPASTPTFAAGPDAAVPPARRRDFRRPRIGLNLTAMIDVVFLLLIYFMVATEFKAGEEIYRLDLPPEASARQPADPFELDEEPLRIRVASVGRLADAVRIEIDGPYPRPESFAALETFLRDRRIGPGAALGLFAGDHPIIIEPATTARWEHAVSVFNAVARAEYVNVTFGSGL